MFCCVFSRHLASHNYPLSHSTWHPGQFVVILHDQYIERVARKKSLIFYTFGIAHFSHTTCM
jgi:hypothetical protein